MNKKTFIGKFLVFISIGSLIFPANSIAASKPSIQPGLPPAIILFIGDGMGAAQRTAGRWASVGQTGQLNMDRLPVSGWVMTHNAANAITDSAAAATAMATGEKTVNGYLSISVDLRELPTILELAQSRGWSVGLVSTTQIAHATPAAFAAHEVNRANYTQIALEMLEHQPNVMLAGGEDDFLPDTETGCYPNPGHRDDGRNLIAEAVSAGYTYICDAAGLAALDLGNTNHLIGLFADDGMLRPYTPTLKQMTSAALDILSQDPDGFFLMVEGGQIDWAAHDNEAELVINDVISFDAAVGQGSEYAQAHPNTLLIVTADHETGGMRVDLESSGEPSEDGPFWMPDGTDFYVNWTTLGHTGVDVPVSAWGSQSQGLAGTLDNTHIYTVMHRLLGWELYLPIIQNPTKIAETHKYQVKSDIFK